mmetsp:Transcript_66824/g.149118  ORF Transcript_66824/g.149118 Transcript_66824/m.149118 type:complete len:225 (+) Transcript_66824:319-993(+)
MRGACFPAWLLSPERSAALWRGVPRPLRSQTRGRASARGPCDHAPPVRAPLASLGPFTHPSANCCPCCRRCFSRVEVLAQRHWRWRQWLQWLGLRVVPLAAADPSGVRPAGLRLRQLRLQQLRLGLGRGLGPLVHDLCGYARHDGLATGRRARWRGVERGRADPPCAEHGFLADDDVCKPAAERPRWWKAWWLRARLWPRLWPSHALLIYCGRLAAVRCALWAW